MDLAAVFFVFLASLGLRPGLVEGGHQGLLLVKQGPLDLEDPGHVHLFQTGRACVLHQGGVADDDVNVVTGQALAGTTASTLIK